MRKGRKKKHKKIRKREKKRKVGKKWILIKLLPNQ